MPKQELQIKTKKAKENILNNYKWEHCANRILDIVKKVQKQPIFKNYNIKIGWVSSWNTKCGIATYSKFLIDDIIDENTKVEIFANIVNKDDLIDIDEETNVQRVWSDASQTSLDELYRAIIKSNVDIVMIEFNFGFFNLYALEELILKLKSHHRL